jgi:transcriptional regulator with PAS, ATPase and Fis domain
VLLDDISEMPRALQAKLLTVWMKNRSDASAVKAHTG